MKRRGLSLAQRLTLAFLGLVGAVLLVNGSISMWFAYREATEAAVRVEQEKADAAADRVAQFIAELEQQIGWTTRADWARVPMEQRRYDFIRLLRQAPAISEVLYVDGEGRERLRLSRLEPDVLDSGTDLSADARFRGARENRVWYGPVTFRRGSEPYMALAMVHAGRNPGATIAEVNLKLIWEVMTAIRVGGTGYAFVTDTAGRLIAHPDMSLVLRDTDLSALPQVAGAIAGAGERVRAARGVDGRAVLSAHATIPRLGWIVFVEQPTSEALAPVYAAAYQTLALLALGVVVALLAGVVLARRLTGPIRALQAGAERLGQGDLAQRIDVEARDEIGTLALRFNEMAVRIQDAQETLEANVADRTRELAESLDDLRAAQDRLVQTEKLASLGQLTAGIAHEIKNPLNFVNNFAELSIDLLAELRDAMDRADGAIAPALRLEIDELCGMLRDNLAKVTAHGRRADSIVRNMLAHSREGKSERRRVDINALVEESLNLAWHGARAERPGFNVAIDKRLDPAAGQLDLYPQEFTRVLLNLFGNAFHAVQQKDKAGFQPHLLVSTQARAEEVVVTVRDNGTGIPETVRSHIFEPFFTTKPPGQGTGLGLSLSHDIVVQQHGGRIEVATAPGEWTQFNVTLPRMPAEQGRAA
ncbi:HAMP domain-containing protein [Roseomonas sp. PWR1]|uniref:histidine kinase n=1 Tax=Roseomonas nitratireducens TaxID=2820810 RepID=A0ABS4AQ45_9PROT|nr:ATP-binding protein [Neoroseomonas nitratireducens]MBP0463487.1 HAMP domain-containing protein [Neoroseomonas nitratireducens]